MAWANVVKKSLPANEPQLSITTSRNANDTKKPVLNGNQPTLSDYDNSFPELGNKNVASIDAQPKNLDSVVKKTNENFTRFVETTAEQPQVVQENTTSAEAGASNSQVASAQGINNDSTSRREGQKLDYQAKKLEEEDKLNERFKNKKENLCFEEKNGSLFTAEDRVALAHCVSADLSMGKGIAVEFKKRFGGVDELLKHYPRVGKCLFLRDKNGRYIFYMITKPKYYHKPTYDCFERALNSLKQSCLKFKVNELAMPRIGCGLDQLNWDLVKRLIDDIFHDTNIKITIYSIDD